MNTDRLPSEGLEPLLDDVRLQLPGLVLWGGRIGAGKTLLMYRMVRALAGQPGGRRWLFVSLMGGLAKGFHRELIDALDVPDPRGVHPHLLCPSVRGMLAEELIDQMECELAQGVWGGVVVDCLQLMAGTVATRGRSRADQLTGVAESLAEWGRRRGWPVWLAANLARPVTVSLDVPAADMERDLRDGVGALALADSTVLHERAEGRPGAMLTLAGRDRATRRVEIPWAVPGLEPPPPPDC